MHYSDNYTDHYFKLIQTNMGSLTSAIADKLEEQAIDRELAKAKEILPKPETPLQVAINKLIEAANQLKKIIDEAP